MYMKSHIGGYELYSRRNGTNTYGLSHLIQEVRQITGDIAFRMVLILKIH